MGILKQKIQASRQNKLQPQNNNADNDQFSTEPSPEDQNKEPMEKATSPQSSISQLNTTPNTRARKEVRRRQRLQKDSITPKIYLEAKNIVTNFGKAIATFAASDLALPYLSYALSNESNKLSPEWVGKHNMGGLNPEVSVSDFLEFVKRAKSNINSIEGLRRVILEEEGNSEKEKLCKKAFKEISEVFVKYFSVNWIIHGRVTYKLEHLKFRNKMLRRIQNPENFTYLKGHKEKRKAARKQTK
jgi:hypothetical protein